MSVSSSSAGDPLQQAGLGRNSSRSGFPRGIQSNATAQEKVVFDQPRPFCLLKMYDPMIRCSHAYRLVGLERGASDDVTYVKQLIDELRYIK